MNIEKEIWLDVNGFEGLYKVSSLGRVKSVERYTYRPGGLSRHGTPKVGGMVFVRERIFKAKPCSPSRKFPGYKRCSVALRREGKTHTVFVHKIVLEAFIGEAPSGFLCRHLNGDGTDNRLSNLCWGTRQENFDDMTAHGNYSKPKPIYGEKHHRVTISDYNVNIIRSTPYYKGLFKHLSDYFGVAPHTISRIYFGESRCQQQAL